MVEEVNPNRKVTIKHELVDADVSQEAITTRVELRENAINSVILTANNEDGANYLATLHLNDEVKVKMVSDSNPPTPIEWDTDPLVKTVFRGRIQELSPLLNRAGQVCSVVAYGYGYQLKEMRVNKKYGAIVPLPSIANTFSFDDEIKEWETYYVSSPWIKDYIGVLIAGLPPIPSIYCTLHGTVGQQMGGFTFILDPEYDGVEFDSVELHIVGGMYGDITSATITPYYSIDGSTWHAFNSKYFTILTKMSYRPSLNGWQSTVGYNPIINTPPPPVGNEYSIDIKDELPYWNKNLRIKLVLSGAGDISDGDEVSIKYMWLKYTFKASQGKTVRQIIAGDAHTTGIVENFVNKILNTNISSSYNPEINTDYVFGYTETENEYKIPYISFPYEDALTSVQDIIKYASGLKFLQSASGYHWIIDVDGNMLLAPVNNHSVYGIDDEHLISDKWELQPYGIPIVVKQDMVTQAFKQEVPLGNFILVAGKYMYPLNDEICKGMNIDTWIPFGEFVSPIREVFLDSYEVSAIGSCLCMNGLSIVFPPTWVENLYAYPLPDDLLNGGLIKLMGKDVTPSIFFLIKASGSTETYEFRLYFEDPDNPNNPDPDNYFKYPFKVTQDTWEHIEINFPNTEWYKDFKGWELITKDGIKDWKDFKNIKYIVFKYTSSPTLDQTYCKIFGLSLNGKVIYGLYDSTNIGLYGCRIITIKDTYSVTNTLNITEIANTPLGLECLYELVRYRKLRLTGEIAIPLDPVWMAGQQVWLQAEDVISVDSTVQSGIVNPTTSTVGKLSDYYVNTVSWEVFLCTVVNPPVYTWTDQNIVRYKINKWFRITKPTHEFNNTGALTRLEVTDDMESSIPINTNDPYATILRVTNIDFQSRSTGSVKSSGDFDLGLQPIIKDYPS